MLLLKGRLQLSLIRPPGAYISVEDIVQGLNKVHGILNILIFDCCRAEEKNKVFKLHAGNEQRELLLTSLTNTNRLVRDTVESQFINIYSCDSGTVAFDDPTLGHSYLTSAILQYLNEPNWNLHKFQVHVTKRVMQISNNKQRPWFFSTLTEEFFFNEG